MGGDHGPSVTVPAAVNFVRSHPDAELLLVGIEGAIRAQLKKLKAQDLPALTVVPASEIVAMDDPVEVALRKKKDSSMRVALNRVKENEAQACISAGNTGALMAVSRYVLKTLSGIERPAIAFALPNPDGYTMMLDLGANVDCEPQHLLQFAEMGHALVSALESKERPTIGLLNIGEEVIKGNETIKRAGELLRASTLNFHGNVEGNDIFKGTVDVIVCDGFVGNVALKTSEGLAQMLTNIIKEEFGRSWLTKVMAVLAMPVLMRFKKRVDHRQYNGAALLGLRGLVIKSHGSADAYGFEWAIKRGFSRTGGARRKRCGPRKPDRRPAGRALRCAILEGIMAQSTIYSRVLGTGSYLPPGRVTNQDLAERLAREGVETSDEWIVARTGIHARHFAEPNVTTSDLALIASQRAIEAADIDPQSIDLIIVATSTPDFVFPSTACLLQNKLGIKNHGAAFDVQAVCSGFAYAVATADSFIRSGQHRTALVIGAETFSRILDFKDRTTCVLFGDGAGAVILQASEEPGVLASALHADGSHSNILCTPGNVNGGVIEGSAFLHMDGQAVFKLAVNVLEKVAVEALTKANLSAEQIDWLIPHQANIRIMQSTCRKLGLPQERMVVTVGEHGNTSAASIPLAFDVAVRDGRIKRGQNVLIEGVGGGFTWGASVIRY
ncbi:hypothetical protein KCU90_g4732, partial [Aureobasidium melanogenum]